MSRRPLFLAAALLALAGVAAWKVLGRRALGDDEAIRLLFDRAARAAEERRVSDAVEGVSERFRGGGLDRRGLKQLVGFHVLRGEWVSVSVASAKVRVEDAARARANVDVVLARGSAKGKALDALLPGEASVHRVACRLEREDGAWRVVEASWEPVGLPEALAGPADP